MSVPIVGSRYEYFANLFKNETIEEIELERKEALTKQQNLNTELIAAILIKKDVELKRWLEEGASPNATCPNNRYTACHLAANTNWSALRILLSYNCDRYRKDRNGLTPIYYAIKAKGPRRIAMLLDFPPELTLKCALTITPAVEEEIKAYSPYISEELKRQLRPDDLEEQDPAEEDFVSEEGDLDQEISRTFLLEQLFVEGSHSVLKVLYAAGFDLNGMIEPKNPLDLVGDFDEKSGTLEVQSRFLETLRVVLSYRAELQVNSETINAVLTKAADLTCLEKALVVLAKAGALTLRNTDKFTPIEICEWNNLDTFKKILQEKDKPAPAPVNNKKRKRCRSKEESSKREDDDNDDNQNGTTSIELKIDISVIYNHFN